MKHILISGATGALGSGLVPLFAAEQDTRVTLLLRADSTEHLARRQKLLDFWQVDGRVDSARIDAVAGDVSAEHLGLALEDRRGLVERVTHVVHSAGNVKLNQRIDAARRTALGSTRGVIEFVRECCKSGQFAKLEFVSTIGVAGRTSGNVPEQRLEGSLQPASFHNTYEAAKWEAECLLWREIDAGLPATVHRPSMIVGNSKSGRILHFQVFYFLTDFLVGRRTCGLVPDNGGAVLDIVPVDYVAKAILSASQDSSTTGRVLHLCSGPEHSWEIDRLVERIRQLLRNRDESLPRLKPIPLSRFRNLLRVVRPVSSARMKRFLDGLPFLLDYLEEKQLFETKQTASLLSNRGIELPKVEAYLESVMNEYWKRTCR